jgi:ATP-dependent exoDNAse (exonuclease V) alpha subunit
VLVGDPRQLPEIEAGGLFARLTHNSSTLRLSDNRRQQEAWERDALNRLRAGNIDPAIDAYAAHGRIHQSEDPEALRAELVSDYLHATANANNSYDVATLAVSRADGAHLNALIRAALIGQGELGATPLHLPADGTGDLVPGHDSLETRTGDLVIIGRNDNRLGLYNGTRAVVTAVDTETHSLTLRTDDDRDITVTATWAARHDMRHAYAMTLHKAQGLTVDHALLYGSQARTREAGHVGLSRGRRQNHIYTSSTTQISGRNSECDFAQADPLADEQRPIAALARRLHTSRTHRLASHQQPGRLDTPRTHR